MKIAATDAAGPLDTPPDSVMLSDMPTSNGNSFLFSDGQSMSISAAIAAGQYPEPWYVRLQGPVQDRGSTWGM